ncbi:MAG: DUF433 domain-containing protein [Halorientalis sp.]
MAKQVGAIVTGDDSDIHDEPHIRDSRITVREVFALVDERDLRPETVADRYSLDIADVYHALAYYHDHPEEMATVEQQHETAATVAREQSSMSPPE